MLDGLIWAEALGMAAWWLLWGGFGRSEWEREGWAPARYLPIIAVLWILGWVELRLGHPVTVLNVGWLGLLTVAAWWATRVGTWRLWASGLLLGAASSMMRDIAPFNVPQASVVSWMGPESLATALLAVLSTRSPRHAAVAAALGSGFSSVWRAVVSAPHEMQFGASDWFYMVATVVAAWMGARAVSAIHIIRPSP